jgi:catechol 2,3-dioxygenase-like lactoylglutathione lyase family enzyme
MSDEAPAPVPRFTVITLGVADMRKSIAFYEALGFARKFRATGEVAFFDTRRYRDRAVSMGSARGRRHAAGKPQAAGVSWRDARLELPQ